MADWSNGNPLIATDEHVKLRWNGSTKNFRCGFCGHKIAVGELWCFVFTNDIPDAGGNPMACCDCIKAAEFCAVDAEETMQQQLRRKWKRQCEEWKSFITSPKWWKLRCWLKAETEQELDSERSRKNRH